MRQDYCPIGGAPCQSMCDEPCLSTAKKRIAELEKDCDILATNYDAARRASRFTADVADQALADLKAAEKQIEQLREALQELMYAHTDKAIALTIKVLEETK